MLGRATKAAHAIAPETRRRIVRLARRRRTKHRPSTSSSRTRWPLDTAGDPPADPASVPDLLGVFDDAERGLESPLAILRRDTDEIAAIRERLGYAQEAEAEPEEVEEVMRLANRSRRNRVNAAILDTWLQVLSRRRVAVASLVTCGTITVVLLKSVS